MYKHTGLILAALLLFCGGALPAADNHIPTDYPDLVPLRWMGPEPRPSYEDYLAGREARPFYIQKIIPAAGGRGSKAADSENVFVLVNADIRADLQDELDRYISDITAAWGYNVELYEQSGGTAEDLRAFLQDHADNLAGCVLVGDFVAAWFEYDENFPADLFFMDLDGAWTDDDVNGLYDHHGAGDGDEGPEIFVGRIDASRMTHGDETELLKSYFDKDHAFWQGTLNAPYFGLTYTEDDWAGGEQFRNDIRYAYPKWQAIYAPATNGTDYLEDRIPNTRYEFIQLSCHSYHLAHAFTRGPWVYSSDIINAMPCALFYNLFCCSASLFTANDFLGGAYIFNESATSLLTIGSSKSGSMLYFSAFYQPLGQGKSFGQAFKEWFDYLSPYDDSDTAWFFGMAMCGDPLLKVRKRLTTYTALYAGAGPGPDCKSSVQGYRDDGTWNGMTDFEAFSQDARYGVNLACGDLRGEATDCLAAGMGAGEGQAPRVRAFRNTGALLPGCDVLAYGTKHWGVNVAAGDLDGDTACEIITGPGPGAAYRPHVRAWTYESGILKPIQGVNLIISKNARWGINVSAGDIDGDGKAEIVTGAGPGPTYGPHVRAFNYDGGVLTPVDGVNFFAYDQRAYGVNTANGMVSRWDREDIITAPGKGPSFGPHIRGFYYINNGIRTSWGIDFIGHNADFKYGATVSCGDLDGWRDEILVGPGPSAGYGPDIKVWQWSTNGNVTEILAFSAFAGEGYKYGVKTAVSLY